jgi:hypothetical protein
MSAQVYHIQIGDGSQYQKRVAEEPAEPAEWKQWYRNNRIAITAGVIGTAESSVLWDDGVMQVRLQLQQDDPDMNPQPDVIVALTAHQWEALVATVASQRRELELRSFGANGDDTEEVGE